MIRMISGICDSVTDGRIDSKLRHILHHVSCYVVKMGHVAWSHPLQGWSVPIGWWRRKQIESGGCEAPEKNSYFPLY